MWYNKLRGCVLRGKIWRGRFGIYFFPRKSKVYRVYGCEGYRFLNSTLCCEDWAFVNPSRDIVEDCIKNVGIDTLQFHGDESSEFCSIFGLPWIKTISVDAKTDIKKKTAQYENASAYLFDTKKSDSFGGTGQVFDWNLIPKDLTKPIILAGGLRIDNIEDAIQIPRLYAVDVCSGVEQEKGKKSKMLMHDFIERVKRIN